MLTGALQRLMYKSPSREFAACLEKEWALTIKPTAWGLLAALKWYHGSCARHLRRQAFNMEASAAVQFDRAYTKQARMEGVRTNSPFDSVVYTGQIQARTQGFFGGSNINFLQLD